MSAKKTKGTGRPVRDQDSTPDTGELSHAVRARVGLRVTAWMEDETEAAVVESFCEHGCFVRGCRTGQLHGFRWGDRRLRVNMNEPVLPVESGACTADPEPADSDAAQAEAMTPDMIARLDRAEERVAEIKQTLKALPIRATAFVLVDDAGTMRAQLAMTDNAPELVMYDPEGKERVKLNVGNYSDGAAADLSLHDEDGYLRLSLGTDSTTGQPVLMFWDGRENIRLDANGLTEPEEVAGG